MDYSFKKLYEAEESHHIQTRKILQKEEKKPQEYRGQTIKKPLMLLCVYMILFRFLLFFFVYAHSCKRLLWSLFVGLFVQTMIHTWSAMRVQVRSVGAREFMQYPNGGALLLPPCSNRQAMTVYLRDSQFFKGFQYE